ncbi:Hypothetical predicted protein [Olea europaea subsp. europaea]|uniref:Uncharacterized protein n=1 Tax=Olea europaea subsp. europaea TaxID=158383 RepID=A0A8S0QI48_OLEEU|nr:Hypothetical predicted protein [Olea europaea subsp. europaea]
MELPQESDDYIKESIDDALGLPVSADTLQLKLLASEDARLRLRNQYLCLHSKLKEKDNVIDSARAEASMNAVALKKFVEENQKLAMECSNLLAQRNKWERECSLYDHDREALMDFANEADERAKEAEIRVHELEEQNKKLSEDLHLYKCQCDTQMIDACADTSMEQTLLDSLLATMFGKDEIESTAHEFLEAYGGIEVCQKILKMWYSLRPSTQNVVALVAEAKNLEKDKDHLTINLHRAEEEVKLLFRENSILDKENKRLIRRCYREQTAAAASGGKYSSSGSVKGNKRKSSPKSSSPQDKKIDLSDINSLRQPLSPLHPNSPESKMHKK